ncbi:hypothetical protein [Cupriavidus sp. IK-TO18]|uniref:hypothetical protein n=1 Tax=Cupriavidus sp. IK-TO18 TaxID=2782182 RepID=UPI002103BE52|nr:hypothetical protein [Cupriavidus sp. IK-TO18]
MTEQNTPIESRARDHVMAEIVHNLTLAMQAAWIEWQHGGGADQAMQWIENSLWGPGLIPDEDEPHGKEAQAYFDAHTDSMPSSDRLDKLTAENPDDAAIDRFAIELKKKLAKARDKGRGGWQTCPSADLSRMLREHVDKGDPRDVANFCAFLWALGQPITPAALCFELSLVSPNGAVASASDRAEEARPALPLLVLEALRFYASGGHFALADDTAWDTVSGEPQNFWCDEAGTATVEDGSIAKAVLQGKAFAFEEPEPAIEGEVFTAAPAAMSTSKDGA